MKIDICDAAIKIQEVTAEVNFYEILEAIFRDGRTADFINALAEELQENFEDWELKDIKGIADELNDRGKYLIKRLYEDMQ